MRQATFFKPPPSASTSTNSAFSTRKSSLSPFYFDESSPTQDKSVPCKALASIEKDGKL